MTVDDVELHSPYTASPDDVSSMTQVLPMVPLGPATGDSGESTSTASSSRGIDGPVTEGGSTRMVSWSSSELSSENEI